jgi:hypothetical protein
MGGGTHLSSKVIISERLHRTYSLVQVAWFHKYSRTTDQKINWTWYGIRHDTHAMTHRLEHHNGQPFESRQGQQHPVGIQNLTELFRFVTFNTANSMNEIMRHGRGGYAEPRHFQIRITPQQGLHHYPMISGALAPLLATHH